MTAGAFDHLVDVGPVEATYAIHLSNGEVIVRTDECDDVLTAVSWCKDMANHGFFEEDGRTYYPGHSVLFIEIVNMAHVHNTEEEVVEEMEAD